MMARREWYASLPDSCAKGTPLQVQLRAAITAVVAFPASDWEAMELSVKIMEPLAMATDLCQRDSATMATVLQELQKLRGHFEAVEVQYPKLAEFCLKEKV